jgi:hypothetical protein|tara:strand:+ start:3803 stop:4369 length:567 start_codon:yes stop_codon:yes gene_type:complete
MALNMLEYSRFSVFSNQRGSLAAEMALCVPAILFLLLGGVTLIQMAQLNRMTERTAAFIGDDLAQRDRLREADFDIALNVMEDLIDAPDGAADVAFHIRAWRQGEGGTTLLWERSRGSGEIACLLPPFSGGSASSVMAGGGILHLLQLDLCVQPGSEFYLSGFLAASGYRADTQMLTIARRPAVLSPE